MKTDYPLMPPKRTQPCRNLDFWNPDIWNCKKIIVFKSLSLWLYVTVAMQLQLIGK